MNAQFRRSSGRYSAAAGIVVTVVTAIAVTGALSDGADRWGGVPVPSVTALVIFTAQWAAFIPSNMAATERYYDLTGSVTYLVCLAVMVALSAPPDGRVVVVVVLVGVWAIRLGTFLFARVRRAGSDGRFDAIKTDSARFLLAWTLQGLWIILTLATTIAIVAGGERTTFGVFASAGLAIWLVGFSIEVVADRQKSSFRADPANADRFITTGLWAWSRHPNYFGEIVLWTGIAVIALPVLSGWRWVALISPVFVAVLLTRISGVPMLERRAERRWGDDPEYRAYVQSTPVLIPRPPHTDGGRSD